VKTQLRVRDDINRVSDVVNRIEWMRRQLEVVEASLRPPKKKEPERRGVPEDEEEFPEPPLALEPVLDETAAKKKAELLKTAVDTEKKLAAIEQQFVSPSLQNSDDKFFVEPYKTYLDLLWLNAELGTGGGDVAGGSDWPPTETQLQLLQSYESEMTGPMADFDKFLKEDLPTLNQTLTSASIAPLLAPK